MTSFTEHSKTHDQVPENMRVFELAKLLDVPAGELLRRVQLYDAGAGTVLSSIEQAVVRNVLLDYQNGATGVGNVPDSAVVDQLLAALEESEHLVTNPVTAWTPSDDNREHDNGFDRASPEDGMGDERFDDEYLWSDRAPARLDQPHADDETQRESRDAPSEDEDREAYGPRREETYLRPTENGVSNEPEPADGEEWFAEAGDVEEEGAPPSEDSDRPDGYALAIDGGSLSEQMEGPDDEPAPAEDTRPLGPVTPVSFLELIDRDKGTDSSVSTSGAQEPAPAMDDEAAVDEAESDEPDLADLELQSTGYAWLRDRVVGSGEPESTIEDTDRKKREQREKRDSKNEQETENERVSRTRWYRVVIAAAIVLATTVLATSYAMLAPTYAAESDVVIGISGLGAEEIQRELQSLNVFAESQTVLAPVAEQFDVTVTELRKLFDSTIVGDSTVFRFRVTDEDAATALAINEAIVASYLEVANHPIDQDELAFVQSQITNTKDAINDLDSSLAQFEATEAANNSLRLQIETERNVALAQLSALQDRLVDLRASGAAPAGSINFVQTQVNEAEARLDELVAEAQALEEADASTRTQAERLRSERTVLRTELANLEQLEVDLELDQIAGTRVAVLAPGHIVDEPVGLTPVRALALGLLVGGALAIAWLFVSTQLRRKR